MWKKLEKKTTLKLILENDVSCLWAVSPIESVVGSGVDSMG